MNKLYKTPIITSIVMLLLALFDLPEGYYTLLRIIVCGVAVYFLFIAKAIKKLSWVWIMGFIAILFNPFIPIYLDKKAWGIIDIIASVVFFIGIFALSNDGVFIIKKPYKKAFIMVHSCLGRMFSHNTMQHNEMSKKDVCTENLASVSLKTIVEPAIVAGESQYKQFSFLVGITWMLSLTSRLGLANYFIQANSFNLLTFRPKHERTFIILIIILLTVLIISRYETAPRYKSPYSVRNRTGSYLPMGDLPMGDMPSETRKPRISEKYLRGMTK